MDNINKSAPPPYSPPDAELKAQPSAHYPLPPAAGFQPQVTAHYPPPPGAGSQPQPTVVVTAVAPSFGPESQSMQCPYCHMLIRTTVVSEANTKTHLWAAILCILGGLLCVFYPYCIDSCQTQKHTCPNCGAFLGKHEN